MGQEKEEERMDKEKIIEYFSDIMCEKSDVCGFISMNSSDHLFQALENLESKPLSKVQFDQLLSLQHLKCMSDDFFRFYWLQMPPKHFYRIGKIKLKEESVGLFLKVTSSCLVSRYKRAMSFLICIN